MRLVPWPMLLICLLLALAVDATRGYSVEVIPAVLVHEEHLDQNGGNRHRELRMVIKEPARQNLLAPSAGAGKCNPQTSFTLGNACYPLSQGGQRSPQQQQNQRPRGPPPNQAPHRPFLGPLLAPFLGPPRPPQRPAPQQQRAPPSQQRPQPPPQQRPPPPPQQPQRLILQIKEPVAAPTGGPRGLPPGVPIGRPLVGPLLGPFNVPVGGGGGLFGGPVNQRVPRQQQQFQRPPQQQQFNLRPPPPPPPRFRPPMRQTRNNPFDNLFGLVRVKHYTNGGGPPPNYRNNRFPF